MQNQSTIMGTLIRGRSFLVCLLALFLLGFAISAEARGRSSRAQNEWDKNAGECFQIFEEFDMVAKEQVAQCVAIWATYNAGGKLRASQRFILVKAFNFLHDSGNDAQSWLAYKALKALGENPEPRESRSERGIESPVGMGQATGVAGGVGTPAPTGTPSAREFYNPQAATKGQHERARKENDKGAKIEKRKQYEEALEKYESAIRLSPRYEMAIFNAARMYSTLGNVESAVRHLSFLVDLGTEEGNGYLHRSRVSKEFSNCRGDQGFKDVTAYAKIKLLNGKGVYGEDEVERIEEYFSKASFPVYDYGDDPHDREFPVIWHKDGTARNTAYILTKLVNHPKTLLIPIDWDTDYDIVVSWGDTYDVDPRTGQPIVREYEMKNPDRATEDALSEQDKALREPEKFARKVDQGAKAPDRAMTRGENAVRRTENTINVIEKTGNTIQTGGGLVK